MLYQPNLRIREAMRNAGVKQWEVAERFGLSEDRFCRRLRHELPKDEMERVLSIIEELSTERSGGRA